MEVLREKRKYRKSQIIPVEKKEEPSEYKTVVGKQELVFKLVNGELQLSSQKNLFEEPLKEIAEQVNLKIDSTKIPLPPQEKERYFRLRILLNKKRRTQSSRRYFYKPGPGERVLRFWQQNFEGEKHDPKKEAVVRVSSQKVISDLLSLSKDFEEVSEKEYLASRRVESPGEE